MTTGADGGAAIAALQGHPGHRSCYGPRGLAPMPSGHRWTNGKAERFNRTLLTEWAYARAWTSNSLRRRGFVRFLVRYNTRRGHSALGGRPLISRLAA